VPSKPNIDGTPPRERANIISRAYKLYLHYRSQRSLQKCIVCGATALRAIERIPVGTSGKLPETSIAEIAALETTQARTSPHGECPTAPCASKTACWSTLPSIAHRFAASTEQTAKPTHIIVPLLSKSPTMLSSLGQFVQSVLRAFSDAFVGVAQGLSQCRNSSPVPDLRQRNHRMTTSISAAASGSLNEVA
jgi:hypothetical protein